MKIRRMLLMSIAAGALVLGGCTTGSDDSGGSDSGGDSGGASVQSGSSDLGFTGLVVLDRRGRELLAGFARPRNVALQQQLLKDSFDFGHLLQWGGYCGGTHFALQLRA